MTRLPTPPKCRMNCALSAATRLSAKTWFFTLTLPHTNLKLRLLRLSLRISSVTRRYRSPHDLISTLKELLVFKPSVRASHVLEQVVEQLYEGRGYFWIGIYLAAGD